MAACLTAVLGALAAWGAAPAGAVVVKVPGTNRLVSIFPGPGETSPAGASAKIASSCTTDCTPVTYGNGPVQHAPVEHFIYWEPPGYNTPFPTSYVDGLSTWLDNVAAEDGTSTNVFSVADQYSDVSGGSTNYISYAITAADPVVATDPLPAPNGCTVPSGFAACLTDKQIQTEIQAVIAANGLPQTVNDEYVLFTPQGVDSCFSGNAGSPCAYAGSGFYCGYHDEFTGPSGPIVYANLPWLYNTSCDGEKFYGLGYPNAPSAPAIDPEVATLSHEMMESITDPKPPTGWTDASGMEIGDKCAYNYNGIREGSGTNLPNNGQGVYNQTINGHQYLMQTEFSNVAETSNGSSTNCVATALITPTNTTPVLTGVMIPFAGAASVDGSPVTTYAWSFGDGTTATTGQAPHAFAVAGTYQVTLTTTNANNLVDSQSVTVSVHGPPIASVTAPASGLAGNPVTFNGTSSSEANGTIAGYVWDFGDGSTATGATTSHTYTAAGIYTVSLTVTDASGSVSTPVTHTIIISASGPAVFINPTAALAVTTTYPTRARPVAFAATGSDPNAGGSITGYSWTFGDGSSGAGSHPTHTYAKAGRYTVTVTVTDREGGTARASRTVTVLAPSTITRVKSRNDGLVVMISVDGPGTVSVGRSHVTLRRAGTAKVPIALSSDQRTLLAHGHRIKIRVAIRFVPFAGPPVTKHETVVLT